MAVTTPAVVYPITTANGYGAVWSLGRAGVPVIGLAPKPTYFSKSKFLREFHVTPEVNTEPELFADFLVELGRTKKAKMVLVVTGDIEAFVINTNRDRLESYYLYPYLNWDQVRATLHRKPMHDVAQAAGIQLPRTWFSDDPSWRNLNVDTLPYPVILKPLVSRFHFDDDTVQKAWAFTGKYGKALEVHSGVELSDTISELLEDDIPICIQERIPCKIDDLWAHHFYCKDGDLIASFTGRKLHQEPPDFGTGSICRAETNSRIVRESGKFLREIRYGGIGNIEYIETPNGYKFVEINPRGYFWSSLATPCGVNLYKIMYDDMCSIDVRKGNYAQKEKTLIWYHLEALPEYFKYKDKRISVLRFLIASKMEAVVNITDLKLSLIHIYRFARRRFWNRWKKALKRQIKALIHRTPPAS